MSTSGIWLVARTKEAMEANLGTEVYASSADEASSKYMVIEGEYHWDGRQASVWIKSPEGAELMAFADAGDPDADDLDDDDCDETGGPHD